MQGAYVQRNWDGRTTGGEMLGVGFHLYVGATYPPKGLHPLRYSGLYAHCVKRQLTEIAHTSLDTIQMQIPLQLLES
jgi:hypothetical protein